MKLLLARSYIRKAATFWCTQLARVWSEWLIWETRPFANVMLKVRLRTDDSQCIHRLCPDLTFSFPARIRRHRVWYWWLLPRVSDYYQRRCVQSWWSIHVLARLLDHEAVGLACREATLQNDQVPRSLGLQVVRLVRERFHLRQVRVRMEQWFTVSITLPLLSAVMSFL